MKTIHIFFILSNVYQISCDTNNLDSSKKTVSDRGFINPHQESDAEIRGEERVSGTECHCDEGYECIASETMGGAPECVCTAADTQGIIRCETIPCPSSASGAPECVCLEGFSGEIELNIT